MIMEAVMSVSSSGVRFAEMHADEVLKAHRSSVLQVSTALAQYIYFIRERLSSSESNDELECAEASE